ncbi:MAG TPA: LUD domain-containing protein [Intrasporangiaceae bacterium]|nr:LUD domain-containing protein [Intrasporangiaceae bacterium]
MTARNEVLQRIRAALGPVPDQVDVPRAYRMGSGRPPGDPQLVELLVDRLLDYRATVVEAADGDVASALAEILADVDGVVLHAPGVPLQWVTGVDVVPDDGRDARALDAQVAAAVTGSVVAIAATGTIVLDGSPTCGRRALTLVPDIHICVVDRHTIVETVPEALARLEPTRPLTFISGPSATSDIELSRVEGVHGPRTLIVILA